MAQVRRFPWLSVILGLVLLRLVLAAMPSGKPADPLRDRQATAIADQRVDWGYWGADPSKYNGWNSHSNRLIPVYTFGIDLNSVRGTNSPYRSAQQIEQLYGTLPAETLNPEAEYFDQTGIYKLQQTAFAAGKRRIILFIFDGMDWQTTQAAAIYKNAAVKYVEGRGTGLHLQDYRGAPTDFGYFVTSPHNDGTKLDVDAQAVLNPGGKQHGGYAWRRAGVTPWAIPADPQYLIGQSRECSQAYTDSSSSATSMTTGIKTYNDAVNVDYEGKQVETIAHQLQRQGLAVGAVTSVPLSHATPAAAYAHNVFRDDYQDIFRDQVGLKSISHPHQALAGMDVLIGTGWGENAKPDAAKDQGRNLVSGNRYATADDLQRIDIRHGGQYRVVQRTTGVDGKKSLAEAAAKAAEQHERLLGFFGAGVTSHLPFRTADGRHDPTPGSKYPTDHYSAADLAENPSLSDMAQAALEVLSKNSNGFWLMVEAGDVDWGSHDNNLDNAIGAVFDGDDAIRAITQWIETHGGWDDTALIVTADHGHYFHLVQPEMIAAAAQSAR